MSNNIEVQLPDGSIAEFPQGTPQETMQAAIETHLGNPANPSQNPDPTERGRPRPNVPNRLTQGQRGEGNDRMPIPRPMSALAGPQGADPAPQVEGAGQPQQGPRTLLDQMTPEQRQAFDALPPEDQQAVLQTGAPTAQSPQTRADQSSAFDGRNDTAFPPRRFDGNYMTPSQAEERLTTWEQGRPEDYTGPRPSRSGSAPSTPDAEASAIEAARLREAQGITDARGSMGANIAAGDREAAAAQADTARAAVAPEGQEPAARPSSTPADRGKRADLRFPRGMSINEVVRGENGAARPESVGFSMGDGSSVQVGVAPREAIRRGERSGLDFLMERSDAIITAMIGKGDITGAMEFRSFIQGENTQRGMRHMNRAVVAANYGDSNAFTSAVTSMVSSMDGDGAWQVDRSGTKLIEDGNGQAVGATVSLRNKDTGEVTTEKYDGMQNVMSALSDWGSPTAAYERQTERVAGVVAQKIANSENYQEAFDDVMKEMFDKSSFVDLEGNAIGNDELQRRYQAAHSRIQQVRPDLVPPSQGLGGRTASGVGAITGGSSGQAVPTMN